MKDRAIWEWYRHLGNPGTIGEAEQALIRSMMNRPEDGRKMNAFQAAWARRRHWEKKRKEAAAREIAERR
jgi:hypothetical protein